MRNKEVMETINARLEGIAFTDADLQEIRNAYEEALADNTFVNREEAAFNAADNAALGLVVEAAGITAIWQITPEARQMATDLRIRAIGEQEEDEEDIDLDALYEENEERERNDIPKLINRLLNQSEAVKMMRDFAFWYGAETGEASLPLELEIDYNHIVSGDVEVDDHGVTARVGNYVVVSSGDIALSRNGEVVRYRRDGQRFMVAE